MSSLSITIPVPVLGMPATNSAHVARANVMVGATTTNPALPDFELTQAAGTGEHKWNDAEKARKAKEAMDDAERRAIALQEAEELAAVQMANVDAAAAAAPDATE